MFKKIKKIILIFILIFQLQYIWSDFIQLTGNDYIVIDDKELIENNIPDIEINKSLNKINISLTLPGFYMKDKEENGDVFQVIDIPGWVKYEKVGAPSLPLKSIVVELTDRDEYEITNLNNNEIIIPDVNIYPSQIKHIEKDSDIVFQKNNSIYSTDTIYPGKNIIKTSLMKKRDKTYLIIEIVPVRVNPATGDLYIVSDMDIEISFNDPVNTLFFSPVLMSTSSYINPELDKYMIIIDDQYENNEKLDEFIEWKKMKGFNVQVVKTSSFPSDIQGAPKAEDIIRYMRKINIEDYPEYLLIIGNENEENGVPGTKSSIQVSTSVYFDHYTDLYTACRDDNDDIVPDLLYGRLPVSNNDELTIMLNKIITMDKNPPSTNMYDKILVASQLQDVYTPYNECDMTFAEISDAIASFFETNYDGNIYQTSRAISIETNGTVDENCTWSPEWTFLWKGASEDQNKIGLRIFNNFIPAADAQDRILSNINNGVSLVQYVGHGDYDKWKYPEIDYTAINNLANGPSLPFVFSSTCLTGAYHKPNNFTKAFLLNQNGGSHAVASHLNVTSIYNTDLVIYGMYMGFLDKFRDKINNDTNPDFSGSLDQPNFGDEGRMQHLGEILNFGKDYMLQVCGTGNNSRYVMETLQLFGDPETFMTLYEPVSLNIDHPVDIGTGSQQMTVHTYEDDVKVCIYNKDMKIHQVKYSSSGTVDFDIENYAGGKINITAVKYGKRPYIGEINVSTDYGFIKYMEKVSPGIINAVFNPQFNCTNVEMVYSTSSVTDAVSNMTVNGEEWTAEINNLLLSGDEIRYKFRYTSGSSTFETNEFIYNYIKDNTPPSAPTIYNITSSDDDPVKIIWCIPEDNENNIKNYKIFIDNDLYLTTEGDSCELPELKQILLDNLFKYTSYSITISAIDIDGNESDKSEVWSYNLEDTIPPTSPGNLTATNVTAATVSLLWNISTDNVGVDYYKIYDGLIEDYPDWDDRVYFAHYDGNGPLYFLQFNTTSSINLVKRNADGTASVVEGTDEVTLDSTSYSLYDMVVKWDNSDIKNSEIWIHFGSSDLNMKVIKYKFDGTKQEFDFTNYISGISLNSYDNSIWVVSRDISTWYQSNEKYIHKIDSSGNISHIAVLSDFIGCTINADTPDGNCWLANQEGSVYKVVKITPDGNIKTFDTINSKISKLQFNPVDNSCWFFSNQREIFFGKIKPDDTVSIEISPTMASSLAVDKINGTVWMIYSEDSAKTDDKLVSLDVTNGTKKEYNIYNDYYSENDLVINPVDHTPWWRSSSAAFHLLGRGGVEVGQTIDNSFTVTDLTQKTDCYFYVYAYDKNGNRSEKSNILAITTGEHNTEPPVINITDPVNGSIFTVDDNIEIKADASDSDGSISNVEFYSDNIKIGEDNTAPYSFVWNNTSIGSYSLTAVAYDDLNVSTTSAPVDITVEASQNVLPTVSLTNPQNGDMFNINENIVIQADASDSDGSIALVEFYIDDVKIGDDSTFPYTFTWNSTNAGDYDITAKALDNNNASAVSNPVSVSITEDNMSAVKVQYECLEKNDVSTSISFNLNIINSTSLNINIDDLKIRYYFTVENPASQEFHCDYAFIGAENITGNFINTDGNNYYLELSFSSSVILSADSQSGNIQIRINKNDWSSYNQSDDYSFDSSYDSLNDYTKIDLFNNDVKIWPINNNTNIVPAVNITSPSDGASFTEGDDITITADASDSDGTISVVEFYEGTTKIGEDTASPYSFTWSNVAVGNYTLTSKAVDNDNAVTTSPVVSITVVSESNIAPAVNITSPSDGVSFTEGDDITITADASDSDGTISVVEFYEGTTKIGEDTASPYSFTWSNVAVGNYTLTSKAIDNNNAVTTSSEINISVDYIDESTELMVQYQCLETNADTNSIRFNLNVVNAGNTGVQFEDLKIRYYFTAEDPAEMQMHCDYSTIGSDNINGEFVNINENEYYLEFSFSDLAGELTPNNNGDIIQIRFNKIDWSMFDQTNDYSFDNTIETFTDHGKISLYLNGSLVWGQTP